ncbi:MAG: hypothetical protein V7701_08980, partial [Sneathiella sp.]
MRLICFTLTLVVILAASSANAGWRDTEWGMTVQQVTDVSGTEIYEAQLKNAAYWEILPKLKSSANFGGFNFLAEYYFDDRDGLTSVRLMPSQTIWCLDMFRYLFKNYTYFGPAEDSYLWHDVSGGNKVQLSRFANCAVTFSS